MIQNLVYNLNSYKKFIKVINNKDFSKKTSVLSNSSVGQHLRHVLEFYICLFDGIKKGQICYDERKRDLLLETDKEYAIQTMDNIIQKLRKITSDASIQLKATLSDKDDNFFILNSSIYRELVYNFDHSVHHQALIKIGLKEFKCNELEDNFGIAPSTIKHNKKCAQ